MNDRLASSRERTSRRGSDGALALALLTLLGLLAAPRAEAIARFQSEPVTTAVEGEPYVYEIVATGVGNVTVTAPNGLPAWLTLARLGSGRYRLSGTPSAGDSGAGIVLRAQDEDRTFFCRIVPAACTDTQAFDITITLNQPPEVVPPGIPDQTATQGQPFAREISGHFTDPDGDPLTFTAAGLPASFTMTAAGRISGTPTSADVRNSPFQVQVTARDGRGGQASDSFVLSVEAAARADVSLQSIATDPPTPLVDEPVEWSIAVLNAGPAGSGSLEIDVEFAGVDVAFTANTCSGVGNTGRRLRCTLAPLASGDSATVEIEGTAAQAGDVYVTASVSSPDAFPLDPDPDNNAAAASVSIAVALTTEAAQRLRGQAGLAVAAGDVDADGYDDLAVATGPDDPLALHLNVDNPSSLHSTLLGPGDSRRGLSSLPLSAGAAGLQHDVRLIDVDGDGHVDAVVASGAGFPSGVHFHDGSSGLDAIRAVGAATDDSRAAAAADLTGDGRIDLVFAQVGANPVLLNQGDREFLPAASLDDGGHRSSRAVVVEHLLGGFLPDLVFANGDGPAHVYRNLGGGEFAAPMAIDPGPTSSVAAGDFNGDGRVDLVFGRDAPGPSGLPSNPVYLNDGVGGFTLAAELGAAETVHVLSADLTGNGALDLVFINAGNVHQIYAGDGNGNFTLFARQFVSADAARAAVGLFSRDRHLDIAIGGLEGVTVFFNDGEGNLGLGNTERPVIELLGSPLVTLEVGDAYEDAGARAVDAAGEELEVQVESSVNTAVVGTYSVSYGAMDAAGNAATPVQRTVSVNVRAEASGGGGGGAGPGLLLLLAAAWLLRCLVRRSRGGRGHGRGLTPRCAAAPLSSAYR